MSLDRCNPASDLFVAVPAYNGSVASETALSLIETVSALRSSGIKVSIALLPGNCYIEAARNHLVRCFLETTHTDMLFVDADVGFKPETVLRLCLATRPLTAAVYPKKTDNRAWPIEFLPGERWADSEGLMEVVMAPTGLMRINRKVFNAMNVRSYIDGSGDKTRAYFRNSIRDQFYGEDVGFCQRWRKLGGGVYILPDAALTHHGNKAWAGSLGEEMKAGAA